MNEIISNQQLITIIILISIPIAIICSIITYEYYKTKIIRLLLETDNNKKTTILIIANNHTVFPIYYKYKIKSNNPQKIDINDEQLIELIELIKEKIINNEMYVLVSTDINEKNINYKNNVEKKIYELYNVELPHPQGFPSSR